MESYLQECKRNLRNINEETKIQIVLGNEACDLDSVVSSLVTAYYLDKVQNAKDVILPVLNVKRNDLPIRTEVVSFLEETIISLNDLICVDEIDLKQHAANGRLSVVLVDHNKLSKEQSYLEPYISRIIDHHAVDNSERLKNYQAKVEAVGSCCTLVAEEIFRNDHTIMDPQIAMLLYGTILLDTVCLSETARRGTAKDKDMVSQLEIFLEGISRSEVFEMLQKAKSDVSKLSPEQLLQKDTKLVSHNSITVAIASLPVLLEDPIEDPTMVLALNQTMSEKKLIAIILLGTTLSNDKSYVRRQLVIYSNNVEITEKLSNHLKKLEEPSLELRPLFSKVATTVIFEQGNATLTRKFVLPAVEAFLKSNDLSGF